MDIVDDLITDRVYHHAIHVAVIRGLVPRIRIRLVCRLLLIFVLVFLAEYRVEGGFDYVSDGLLPLLITYGLPGTDKTGREDDDAITVTAAVNRIEEVKPCPGMT